MGAYLEAEGIAKNSCRKGVLFNPASFPTLPQSHLRESASIYRFLCMDTAETVLPNHRRLVEPGSGPVPDPQP
jgi:hypothetical protein